MEDQELLLEVCIIEAVGIINETLGQGENLIFKSGGI